MTAFKKSAGVLLMTNGICSRGYTRITILTYGSFGLEIGGTVSLVTFIFTADPRCWLSVYM